MASKATATRSASKAPPKAVAANAAAKNAKPAGKDDAEKDEGAPDQPLPLLDLSDAAVKKMINAAKKRG
jgi:RNA polymerase primary sigma factor